MDSLPSSKNASVLRKEDVLPPTPRLAAKAAAKSITESAKEKTKLSLGAAIDRIYKEWKEEAKPAEKRTPFQRMEALVYKTVKNFRTYLIPVTRGREILNDVNNPELCLGDVFRVLQSIASSVKSYGCSARAIAWRKKCFQERAFGVIPSQMQEQEDSSTDDEEECGEMDVKPAPPYKNTSFPNSLPSRFAAKSFGGQSPSSTHATSTATKREAEFDQPEFKRQMQEKKPDPIPQFVAKTPASVPSFIPLMQERSISPPPPSNNNNIQYGWNRSYDPIQPSSSASFNYVTPYVPPTNNIPPFHHMMARISEIDKQALVKWNETHSVQEVDTLLRNHDRELALFDAELIEHWDQLPLCILLHRLFHERTSRGSFHQPAAVGDVILHVMRGSLTGKVVGSMYDPALQSCRELLEIAKKKPLWEVFISVLTYHMRTCSDDRSQERRKLHRMRRILFIEADRASFFH